MSRPTLGPHLVTRLRAQIGLWGLPWFDVDLAEVADLSGPQVLTIGDTPIACAVVSGGSHGGRSSWHLVGGAGGWTRALPAKGYADDLGCRSSLVLGDAAVAVGETLDGAPVTRLGPRFARLAGIASGSLQSLAPGSWRVDLDGVTRFGARPSAEFATGVVTAPAAAGGVSRLASVPISDLPRLVPGVTIPGQASPVVDVEWSISEGSVSATVWHSPRAVSRRLAALARIFDALDPLRRYRGSYEVRVLGGSDGTLDVQPVRTSTGLSILSRVAIRPGMAGLDADILAGSTAALAFLDSDPSRPFVYAFDEIGSPGWFPLEIRIGRAPHLAAARMTDPVICGPFSGTIVQGSTVVKIGGL
jgi:hypothetical protein